MADREPRTGIGRWLHKRPLLVSLLAAAGFLGLFQTAVLLGRLESMGGGAEMAWGLARFSLIVAFLTVLLFTPGALMIRRLHPAWRSGEPHRASWAVCFGFVSALAGWMLAEPWTGGRWIPDGLGPWIAVMVASVFAFAASWVRPPLHWLRLGAGLTPVALVLSFLPVGDGYGPPAAEEDEPATVTAAEPGRPDVVLISIDTLRADRLGVYGRSPSLTPEMDRLAHEGVLFERALAASPWTVPSVASMLTGLPTLRHGAGWPLGSGPTYERSPLAPDFTSLAERFAAAGYRTRAVVANGFLAPWTGMAQGFQEFDNPWFGASFASFMRELPLTRLIVALTPIEKWGDYRAQGVTERALAWLAEDDTAPLFLWAHYIDPHSPFQADPAVLDPNALLEMADQKQPEVLADGTVVGEYFVATDLVRSGVVWLGPEDRARLVEYYDRAVRYTDEQIGRLLATLRARSDRRPVIIALTSDHGEEFWDHGYFEHGHDYYREITQIPLVLWGPGLVPPGQVVDELVGLVDVAPTLLALAGLEVPDPQAADEGRSLVTLWQGDSQTYEGPTPPRFSMGNVYNLPAVLVEDGPWRFVLRANDEAELYHLIRDPEERYNVALEFPEIAERYRQLVEPRLDAFLAGSEEEGQELTPEARRALKALGYVD